MSANTELAGARRRAEGWKSVALETRQVLGNVLELLGECQAHLETLSCKGGWCITDEYVARSRDLMQRVSECVDGAKVPVPNAIYHEVRAIDRATTAKE